MGSNIEINDTLKISKERGFPQELKLEQHVWQPFGEEQFRRRQFPFWNKDERLYHRTPTRCFLVEETPEGLWIYWGHAQVIQQTIKQGRTEGIFEIAKLYDPRYQLLNTVMEAPQGKSFYEPDKLEWLLHAEGGMRPLHRLQEYVAGRVRNKPRP